MKRLLLGTVLVAVLAATPAYATGPRVLDLVAGASGSVFNPAGGMTAADGRAVAYGSRYGQCVRLSALNAGIAFNAGRNATVAFAVLYADDSCGTGVGVLPPLSPFRRTAAWKSMQLSATRPPIADAAGAATSVHLPRIAGAVTGSNQQLKDPGAPSAAFPAFTVSGPAAGRCLALDVANDGQPYLFLHQTEGDGPTGVVVAYADDVCGAEIGRFALTADGGSLGTSIPYRSIQFLAP